MERSWKNNNSCLIQITPGVFRKLISLNGILILENVMKKIVARLIRKNAKKSVERLLKPMMP